MSEHRNITFNGSYITPIILWGYVLSCYTIIQVIEEYICAISNVTTSVVRNVARVILISNQCKKKSTYNYIKI